MARIYSDNFTADPAVIALPAVPETAPSGKGHSRLRHKRVEIELATHTAADEIRLAAFNSGDRILSISASNDAAIAGGIADDLGVYLAGDNHDGEVVDVDLFDADVAPGSGLARTDWFTGGVLGDVDRGRKLWELCDIGATSYGEDPKLNFEIVLTLVGNITAGGTLLVEFEYISGD